MHPIPTAGPWPPARRRSRFSARVRPPADSSSPQRAKLAGPDRRESSILARQCRRTSGPDVGDLWRVLPGVKLWRKRQLGFHNEWSTGYNGVSACNCPLCRLLRNAVWHQVNAATPSLSTSVAEFNSSLVVNTSGVSSPLLGGRRTSQSFVGLISCQGRFSNSSRSASSRTN